MSGISTSVLGFWSGISTVIMSLSKFKIFRKKIIFWKNIYRLDTQFRRKFSLKSESATEIVYPVLISELTPMLLEKMFFYVIVIP